MYFYHNIVIGRQKIPCSIFNLTSSNSEFPYT
jgi:hypothetical protein